MKPQHIQTLYQAGYMISDIKATLATDATLEVGGVNVKGRQGEVVSIPLRVGRILQRSGIVDMELPNAVTELKQALIREKVVGEYQMATLDKQFYIRLKYQIEEMEERDRDDVGGMMMELVRLRRGKIVRLADAPKLSTDIQSKITIEERVFFDAISQESRRFEEAVRYSNRG